MSPGTRAALGLLACWALIPLALAVPLIPVARWDVVPHQRIDPGRPLNVGVVAFSKHGIAGVDFVIQGQGYRGPSLRASSEMALNEQTGVYEYWIPIDAADFASDGPITVEAVVHGTDGGVRDKDTGDTDLGLEPLELVVNPNRSLVSVQAWVSPFGNDATAAVEDRQRPFASLSVAIAAVRETRDTRGLGNNADGGVIRLMRGTHVCSTAGVPGPIECDHEWLTITSDAEADSRNTVLLHGGIVPTRKIHVSNLTISGSGALSMAYHERIQAQVWADNCTIIGDGRGRPWDVHPLSSEYRRLYYTDCRITQVNQATSGAFLCRGLTIRSIADDAFQNAPLVVNCRVDDIDPVGTSRHADCWQHFGGLQDDNVIVYDLVATGLKYQSLFIRGDVAAGPSFAQGMAFVNVYMAMAPNPAGWGGWGRWVDHLLLWNCTLETAGLEFFGDTYDGQFQPCVITNASVKGCRFKFLGAYNTDMDWTQWEHNHFALTLYPWISPGIDATTGEDMLGPSGMPEAGSVLLQRFAPVVSLDGHNRCRLPMSDVGAFQSNEGADLDFDCVPDVSDPCPYNPSPNCIFGDADEDGDVDMTDFAVLQRCLTPAPGVAAAACRKLDVDDDGMVGEFELQVFTATAQGPGIAGLVGDVGIDQDLDGIANDEDNCPSLANADQLDLDRDGQGDACDEDIDGDWVRDDGDGDQINGDHPCLGLPAGSCDDNCPIDSNADQADLDQDGKGDACEDDLDGDGVLDDGDGDQVRWNHPCSGAAGACDDNCPRIINPDQVDADGDHVGDPCDDCPTTIPGAAVDSAGCPPPSRYDFDHDGDIDLADLERFQACASGPALVEVPAACDPGRFARLDRDVDGDVDAVDFAWLQACVGGEGVPFSAGCN